MSDLIERLEKAEAGSVPLDCEVVRQFGYHVPEGTWQGWHDPDGNHIGLPPKVTTSLDAALALAERVLPGHVFYSIDHMAVINLRNICVAQVSGEADGCAGEGEAATPALALCIAILRAAKAQGAEA